MTDLYWHSLTTTLFVFMVLVTVLQIVAATKYSVSLNTFEQRFCKTKCLEGLLENLDNLFLSGIVTITDLEPGAALPTISLQWRTNKDSPFHDFSLVPLDKCRNHDSKQNFEQHDLYCETTEADYVFNIYLNMTANSLFSEKEVMLIAYSSLETSQVIKLPKIYNAGNANLTINEQGVNDGCSNIQLEKASPNIKFCCQGTATPCEVIINHSGVQEVTDTGCVSYSIPDRTSSEFTFKSVLCGHQQLSRTYHCNFKQIEPDRLKEKEPIRYDIILAITAVCAIVVIVGIVIYFKRRVCRGKSKTTNTLESAKFKQF